MGGSNKKYYGNSDYNKRDDYKKKYDDKKDEYNKKKDNVVKCTRDLRYVCCNGRQYDNACLAEADGIKYVSKECREEKCSDSNKKYYGGSDYDKRDDYRDKYDDKKDDYDRMRDDYNKNKDDYQKKYNDKKDDYQKKYDDKKDDYNKKKDTLVAC